MSFCIRRKIFDSVLELTEGRGADVILDPISGPVTRQSLGCLAMYGRLAAYGDMAGSAAAVETSEFYPSCRAVFGYSFGTTRKHRPRSLQKLAEEVLTYIAEGKLGIVVGHRFSLADAASAHLLVESRQSIGKVLLLP